MPDTDKSSSMTNGIFEIINPGEIAEFRRLGETYQTGIALIPRPYGAKATVSLHSDGGDFAKWLRATNTGLDVHLPTQPQPRVLLRDNEIRLPLIWLGKNVLLPVFLGLLVNYLYERAKGTLAGEKVTAHVEAVYYDGKTGIY